MIAFPFFIRNSCFLYRFNPHRLIPDLAGPVGPLEDSKNRNFHREKSTSLTQESRNPSPTTTGSSAPKTL